MPDSPTEDNRPWVNLTPNRVELAKTQSAFWGDWRALQYLLSGGKDLRFADLKGASLRQADLKGANLLKANLERAVLSRADLSGSNLMGANLQGAFLDRTNLSATVLFRANLENAHLFKANLEDAYLCEANLFKAHIWEASLHNADLSYGLLGRANLNHSSLVNANFEHADLRLADLRGANLENARMQEANIEGAYITDESIYSRDSTTSVNTKRRFVAIQLVCSPAQIETTTELESELRAICDSDFIDICAVFEGSAILLVLTPALYILKIFDHIERVASLCGIPVENARIITGAEFKTWRRDLPSIFICYKRDDTKQIAPRIREDLQKKFGSTSVFLDRYSIKAGEDVDEVIEYSAKGCKVFIALAGAHWKPVSNYVTKEISIALDCDKQTIPIAVDVDPKELRSDLPPDIQRFGNINAMPLDSFQYPEFIKLLCNRVHEILRQAH